MIIALAVALYLLLVAFVVGLLTYYFKVIRPKDEEKLIQQQYND
jgi:protein-S-isoprenylcysteine O-methyltransferase Ste14